MSKEYHKLFVRKKNKDIQWKQTVKIKRETGFSRRLRNLIKEKLREIPFNKDNERKWILKDEGNKNNTETI